MNKYVITGGPCTGKTTLLEQLGLKGFETLPETARLVIEREQGRELATDGYKGIFPWTDLYGFQKKVATLQTHYEDEAREKDSFLDRCLVDGIAYCRNGGIRELEGVRDLIRDAKYTKVFFLEQLDIYEKDDQRREDREEGLRLHNELYKTYTDLGFEVERVPPIGIEERVDYVLQRL